MTYPIFFPRGESGWHTAITHVQERATAHRNNCTLLQFYTHRLAIRRNFSPINYGKFFQKYIVDAFYRVEVKRLAFIKRNQGAIRVERYKGRMYHLNYRGARLKKGAFTRKT